MFHAVLVGFLRMTRSVVFVPVLPYLSLSISVEHEHNFSSGLCVGSWKNSINNCSYSKGKVSSFFS